MPLFHAQSSTKLGLQLQLAWHKRRGIGGIHPNKSAFLPRIPAIASDHDMVVQCIVLRGPMTDFAAVSVHLKLAAAASSSTSTSSIARSFSTTQPHKLSDQIFLARTKCACVALQTECHGRMQRTLGGLGDVSVLDGHGYSRVVATSKRFGSLWHRSIRTKQPRGDTLIAEHLICLMTMTDGKKKRING